MKSISLRRILRPAALMVFAALIFFFAAQNVYAYDKTYTDPDTGYEAVIEDQAGLFTEGEMAQIIEAMGEVTAYGNAVCLTADENFYSASYLAQEYYEECFGYESGTIFLIDMDNREICIYSCGTVYKTITSSKADTITDNVYKLASDEEYADCAIKAFGQMATLLSGGKIAQPMKYIGNALMAILIALLINFIIIYTTARMNKKQNVVDGAKASVLYTKAKPVFIGQTRIYSPRSKGDGGGGPGGGHSGGGGGGGGGHSGGGGGHGF